MSIPPHDYPVEYDPILLERQRRRYASRAIAYLIALNGIAALILMASLPHLAGGVVRLDGIRDAMLIFGAGAAVALGSTFFAYVRRTVRLQDPGRAPVRVSLWWLSVLAAIAATGCFLIGLNMAGRAAFPERAGISKVKGHKDQSRAERKDRKVNHRARDEMKGKADKQENDERTDMESEAPAANTTEGPQPLNRTACEEAGRTWNENTNTCS